MMLRKKYTLTSQHTENFEFRFDGDGDLVIAQGNDGETILVSSADIKAFVAQFNKFVAEETKPKEI